jgi:hypothetical protein
MCTIRCNLPGRRSQGIAYSYRFRCIRYTPPSSPHCMRRAHSARCDVYSMVRSTCKANNPKGIRCCLLRRMFGSCSLGWDRRRHLANTSVAPRRAFDRARRLRCPRRHRQLPCARRLYGLSIFLSVQTRGRSGHQTAGQSLVSLASFPSFHSFMWSLS